MIRYHRAFVLISILSIYFVLAVLTASIPSKKPYSELDIDKLARINTGDTAFVILASTLVLLMTPGLALFYGIFYITVTIF